MDERDYQEYMVGWNQRRSEYREKQEQGAFAMGFLIIVLGMLLFLGIGFGAFASGDVVALAVSTVIWGGWFWYIRWLLKGEANE